MLERGIYPSLTINNLISCFKSYGAVNDQPVSAVLPPDVALTLPHIREPDGGTGVILAAILL